MKIQIRKWGNSLALRIPKSFAVETKIEQGTTVDVSLEGGGIVLRPTREELTLEDLLENVTDENIHGEIDFGKGKGREVW